MGKSRFRTFRPQLRIHHAATLLAIPLLGTSTRHSAPGVAGCNGRASAAGNGNATAAAADSGFASPENLVYDAQSDVFLVSNINGGPTARDANGFISRVAPDGHMLQRKWIDGSKSSTRLDGPKGLALSGDTLFVADVGAIRMFDRNTGTALGVRTVPGQLLNDIAVGPHGALYVTDTGPDSTQRDTSHDHAAVYRVDASGHVTTIVQSPRLDGPDGIVLTNDGVRFTTFRSKEIVQLGQTHVEDTVKTMPSGQLDGFRQLPDGSWVVTSWGGRAVYHLLRDGSVRTVLSNVQTPAGVTYDTRRHRLAVTSMKGNAIYFAAIQ